MSTNHFFLQVPQNKPSKQILMRKMKHISQVDKQIRKNWKNLFKFINRPSPNPELSPNVRLLTDCTDAKALRRTHKQTRINSIHSQIKREQVHERQRKNEGIFFKKHSYDINNILRNSRQERPTQGLSKRYSLQLQSQKKLQGGLPFMLRKRRAKIEKEMSIINHNYRDSLKEIKSREHMKCSLSLQERQGLIDSMKGTKVYYHFLKEWRSDQQDTL